jgi:uncharacterized protein
VKALRLLAGVALVVATLIVGTTGRAAAETPIPDPPARWVTDRAAFLSPSALAELDGRLGTYAQQTGHQALVYIDHTTGGVPIEDWANRAFQRWRVGRKGIDDGVVLFIFSDDHRLRVEVGYGLEDRVPDVVASRIINDRMVPRIRAGDRDGAVRAGVDALVAAIGAPPGTNPARELQDPSGQNGAPQPRPHLPWWMLIVGPVLLVLFIRFAIRHPVLASLMMMNIGSGRRGGGGWGGGGGGGGGGFSGGGGSSGGGGASGSW